MFCADKKGTKNKEILNANSKSTDSEAAQKGRC